MLLSSTSLLDSVLFIGVSPDRAAVVIFITRVGRNSKSFLQRLALDRISQSQDRRNWRVRVPFFKEPGKMLLAHKQGQE
jgi:hypothetical protein